MKELLELKITGLRKLAKEYEIPNFSSMTKAELINYVAIEQKGRT
ncbi:MAG: Rho termination factor N-terminal domain-containing protein, partial [Leptotrichiaceae bacterium]|nr:Rho termination factor N-terminal domain-containing protein [Leptotrichiaceae bacterium]